MEDRGFLVRDNNNEMERKKWSVRSGGAHELCSSTPHSSGVVMMNTVLMLVSGFDKIFSLWCFHSGGG